MFIIAGFGIFVFKLLKIRNPWFLGSLIFISIITALDINVTALPSLVSATGQVLIAVSLCTQFSRGFIKSATLWIAQTVTISSLEIILCLLMVLLFGLFSTISTTNLVLSFHQAELLR